MDEHAIRELLAEVKRGRVSRRQFVRTMLAAGLTAPMAANLLTSAGVAHAQQRTSSTAPTRRGGGGQVRMLYWAAPTLLNPHLAVAPKDFESSQLFYEPLADIDTEGNIVPVLAAETPTAANGGVARDGTSVVWRLKRGVTWHDGRPFTADDVIFTWQYAADSATAATSAGSYQGIDRIERLDDHTVKLVFKRPTPYWADAFCSAAGMVLPRHVFEPFRGGKSREAPANLKPVGTGPYRYVDFKPGDVLHAEINSAYHVQNRPYFDTVEMKGGGDPVSAARAVLQTGEYDYAWGVQMEHEILKRLEQSPKGRFVIGRTANVEYIQLNQTDPWREVDGERASVKTAHPFLTDPTVRAAFALLVDRDSIQKDIWGRQADTTANFMNRPPFVSPNTRWEFNVDKANAMLDAAGWKRGTDGIRVKDGIRLKVLFQGVNQPIRQKIQSIVKQAFVRAGVDCELKSVVGSVYFSSDPGNVDTESHFYADLELSGKILRQPDPQAFMRAFCSWEVAQKANKWSGSNLARWRNDEYDRLWRAAETELDPVKRAAQFIRMNDLVVQNVVVIPVIIRHATFAVTSWLRGFDFSPFSGPLWRLVYWSREA
ncbi:MAG TPA: peptide ABC transporter substrate-binding protein [Methylomirabilota bacterium]|nr:peptide ABC transporter substrate-binding protein [Methylomirabilota bacterium]